MTSKSADPKGGVSDDEWDAFLERTPLGQFQQSARWGRVKAQDGWQAHRVLADPSRVGAGGMQLLWRQSRLGRIGYVSKGPVLAPETPAAVEQIFGLMRATARQLGLRALIVQPPDNSTVSLAHLARHGFLAPPVPSVISATAMIDLGGGKEAVFSRMNRQVRREMRIAAQQGVTTRCAERSDLPRFFELMVESSRRQKSAPNPNRVALLEALWDQFWPHVQLRFACVSGCAVAGLLTVAHGRRMTFWKKGWDAGNRTFANCLLNADTIGWACDQGFETVDFVGMSPTLASSLLAGSEMTAEQRRGRDLFNLRFGAAPKLLPTAHLFVASPLLRALVGLALRPRSPLRQWILRRIGAS